MKRFALAAAFGAVLLSAAAAQDPPPKPEPKPEPKQDGGAQPPAPPAAPAAPALKDPSKSVGGRIEEALKLAFSPSAAGRQAARASLDAAIADWAGEVKDDPLKAVKYWRTAFGSTLPAGPRKTGIYPEKFTYIQGREMTLWVSIPKSYGPKALSPMVLLVLDKGEDPKRVLPALYGDCLKDWVVVAISLDPKEAGIDLVKEPWLAAQGLRWAADNLRVDRDRVVLDGTGAAANFSLAQGAEWAVQFAGCILRSPTATTPLLSNLALGSVLLLAPEAPPEGQKKVAEEIRAAVPAAVAGPAGKGEAEAVQKWLAALAPRRIAGGGSLAWKYRPTLEGEPWAYWLWIIKAGDGKRIVEAHVARDAAGATFEIQSDNLAEGVLLLNDEIVGLDREIAVKVNGKEVWKGKPERQIRTALYWILQTGDRTLFAPAEIRFTVPADLQAPKKDGAANPGNDPAPPPPPPPPGPAPGSGDGDDLKDGDKKDDPKKDGEKKDDPKKDGDKKDDPKKDDEKKGDDKGEKKGDDKKGD